MIRYAVILGLLSATLAFAQDSATSQATQEPAKRPISPSARLAAAKTAYVKNGGGSDVPFNLIENALEGWPHFILVDSPEHADVIIQIDAPYSESSTSLSSSTNDNQKPVTKKTEPDVDIIKMTVFDAKTHLPLWASSERPKSGFREKTRDDNLIAASEKLLARFRDRLEPPTADAAPAEKK